MLHQPQQNKSKEIKSTHVTEAEISHPGWIKSECEAWWNAIEQDSEPKIHRLYYSGLSEQEETKYCSTSPFNVHELIA